MRSSCFRHSRVLGSSRLFRILPKSVRSAVATCALPFLAALTLFVAMPATSAAEASGYAKFFDYAKGGAPVGGLVQGPDGALYGVRSSDEKTNIGLIYRIQRDGSGYTEVRRFTGENGDGAMPTCGLTLGSDGMLYGVTRFGGDLSNSYFQFGQGVVFRLNTDGSGYTILHIFKGGANDGALPTAPLIQGSDGLLYGTTEMGGPGGNGTIFRLQRDGSGFQLLKVFNYTDGSQPWAALTEGSDKVLYGTTAIDGVSYGGTVFRINRDGTGFRVLKFFADDKTGGRLSSPVIEGKDGALYGVTELGGPSGFSQGMMYRSRGVIFRIERDGSQFSILKYFKETTEEGVTPVGGLLQGPDGSLYGVNSYGGGINNGGTLYRIKTDGSDFTVLHTFSGNATDGSQPLGALLAASDGNVYGATTSGGRSPAGDPNYGTIFRFTPEPGTSLANLSVRSVVGSGNNSLIVGFVLSDTAGKALLMRGIGPTLGSFGLSGTLPDPVLTLYKGTTRLTSNDDWSTASNAAEVATTSNALYAFALANGSRDAVLLQSLSGGLYSAQVEGKGSATGVGLMEVYDAAVRQPGRLLNVSARARVGTGDDVLVAGFVVTGGGTLPLLIRGVGPTLATFGVSDVLADPVLTVYRQSNGEQIAQNDNWSSGPTLTAAAVAAAANAVYAFPLPIGSKDAALVTALPPGNYSAKVAGAGNTTGVALIEVYEIPGNIIGSIPSYYTLNVTMAGTGQGTIATNPSGLAFTAGTVVTLTAQPEAGSVFAGWSGAASGNATSVQITMDGNKAVTATFNATTPVTYRLTTGTTGNGQGTILATPSGSTFAAGSVVTLTAQPAPGSSFAGWSGAVSGSATTVQITMDADKAVNAAFVQQAPSTCTLTTATNGTGQGSIVAMPAGPVYTVGTLITLTAQPAPGSTFAGWSGAVSGTGTSVQVTMDGDKAVTATFNRTVTPTYTLTATTAGTGQGSIAANPAGPTYASGTVVTLTAQPGANSTFAGWSGAVSGSAATVQVTMNGDKAVSATFTLNTVVPGPSSTLRVYPGQVLNGSYDPYKKNSVVNGGTLFADGGAPYPGYTWSVANLSSLPPGVSLAPNGLLTHSGGTVVPGRYTFNVTVSDGSRTATGSITLNIGTESTAPDSNGIPGAQAVATLQQLLVPSFALVGGRVGQSYGSSVYAMFGTGTAVTSPVPLTWGIASGSSLPPGLTLDASRGVIYGTPTAAGTYNCKFTVRGTNGETAVGSPTYTIKIDP